MKPKLVTRRCLCGCGLTFRVAAGNTTNYFYSKFHVYQCQLRGGKAGKLARAAIKKMTAHKPTQLGKSRIAKRQTYEPEFCEFSTKEPDADD